MGLYIEHFVCIRERGSNREDRNAVLFHLSLLSRLKEIDYRFISWFSVAVMDLKELQRFIIYL